MTKSTENTVIGIVCRIDTLQHFIERNLTWGREGTEPPFKEYFDMEVYSVIISKHWKNVEKTMIYLTGQVCQTNAESIYFGAIQRRQNKSRFSRKLRTYRKNRRACILSWRCGYWRRITGIIVSFDELYNTVIYYVKFSYHLCCLEDIESNEADNGPILHEFCCSTLAARSNQYGMEK